MTYLITPAGLSNYRNDASQPIVEERKNRTDLASDFESFRDDPWAPDMLYTYTDKEENATQSSEIGIQNFLRDLLLKILTSYNE